MANFCRPGLATGANNGSSFADAWQSFADMDAGHVDGVATETHIPEGTYTGETMALTKSGVDTDNTIHIRACTSDGSRVLTREELGDKTRGVIIDGESSLTNCITGSSINWNILEGIRYENPVQDGYNFTSSGYTIIRMGGGSNSGRHGLYGWLNDLSRSIIDGGTWENSGHYCIMSDDSTMVQNAILLNNSTIAIIIDNAGYVYNCIVDNSGNASLAAIYLDAYGVVSNCVLYKPVNDAIRAGAYAVILNNRFVDVPGTCFLAAGATSISKKSHNAYYNVGSKESVATDLVRSVGEIDMTGHGMIDPANGNYMSDPATDEARNIEHYIDDVNSVFVTAGISPEITSGGGGSDYHFRPGQARGPVTH